MSHRRYVSDYIKCVSKPIPRMFKIYTTNYIKYLLNMLRFTYCYKVSSFYKFMNFYYTAIMTMKKTQRVINQVLILLFDGSTQHGITHSCVKKQVFMRKI